MKTLKMILITALVLLPSTYSGAEIGTLDADETIRVLLVADNLFVDPDLIDEQIGNLVQTWSNSGLDSTVNIQIVNLDGVPLEFDLGFFHPSMGAAPPGGGIATAFTMRDEVKEFVNLPVNPAVQGSMSRRQLYAADIVIAFAFDVPGFCGLGYNPIWANTNPMFISNPDRNGLDMRAEDDYFIALISQNPGFDCDALTNVAAHELGHLMGGGHYDLPSAPVGYQYLHINSRADVRKRVTKWFGQPWVTWFEMSALGEPTNSLCGINCVWKKEYSRGLLFWENPLRTNKATLTVTALSVANYENGDGLAGEGSGGGMCNDGLDNDADSLSDAADPQCATCGEEYCPPLPPLPPPNCNATVAPVNVYGVLVRACVPETSQSEYLVTWQHACPEQVTDWEIWTTQPLGQFPGLDWTVTTQRTPVFIWGPQGRVWVIACGVGGCSGLSQSSFIATDICP